ncbi:hypothetical protein CJ204_02785 [Corynebacterium xerosis]|uniref:Uncharacterized protein n=1 Tax=Corynebacterium xerosis TaxID=1725 RepID=A0A2N6T0Y8_9CORY|nr:hypothetical protein [Corynebacterium xerosis]PMC62977.1 hypothetical protein CJ204_02785 [Corynebacterium xerosis]
MSEEKLTVAELLARRNQESGDSDGAAERPRRRRRSLEEGGVSVAELTGSIPRVEAEGPRRGAHAIADDDDQVEVPAEAPVGDTASAELPETPESPEIPEAPESGYADELAAAEEFGDEPIESADPAQIEADEPAPVAGSGEDVETAEVEYADELAADEPVEPMEPVEPAESREPFAVPSAVPVDPRAVMANDETGEITFTFTKFHDARTASEPVAEAGPMAREVLEGSLAYDDRPTSVIPVIEGGDLDEAGAGDGTGDGKRTDIAPADEDRTDIVSGADDRAFDGSAIAGGAFAAGGAGAMADHADDVPAAYRERDEEFAAHEHEAHEHEAHEYDAHEFDAHDRGVDPLAAAAPAAAAAATWDSRPEQEREREPEFEPEREPERDPSPKATKKSREDYSEDNTLSIGLLIAQTIVGLFFGGLAFALFMLLWMVLPTAVVAVIAVAFAFGLVIIVNLLRRERDRVTPILAGIVGLVVSFAPYVLTMM